MKIIFFIFSFILLFSSFNSLNKFSMHNGQFLTSNNDDATAMNRIRNFGGQNSNKTNDFSILAYCFVNIDGLVYDLGSLYDAASDYTINSGRDNFYFNFCKHGVTKCKKDHSYIVAGKSSDKPVNNTLNECSVLSGTNYKNYPKWKITGVGTDSSKISITLPDGDHCESGNIRSFYSTTYEISCDKNIERLAIDNAEAVKTSTCTNTIKMRSQYACPNPNKYSLSDLFVKYCVIFGIILIVNGVYYSFFSYKYLKVTRVLTGVSTVLFISLVLFANNVEINFNSVNFWTIVILSLLIGLFLGYVISKVPWIVSAFLGAFLGFIFTELLYQAIIGYITWNPKGVYYIIFSLSVAIGATLGGLFQKHIFIVSCAFMGAYSIIRGVGMLENNFPQEQQLFDLIERAEWPQVESMIGYRIYLYLLFSFILGCIGSCYQYRFYFKDIKDDYSTEFQKI